MRAILIVLPLLCGCMSLCKSYDPDFGSAFDLKSSRTGDAQKAKQVGRILGVTPGGERAGEASPEEVLAALEQLAGSDRALEVIRDLGEEDRKALAGLLGMPDSSTQSADFAALAALELRLRFAAEPVAKLPVRVAFIEAGTDDWTRVVPDSGGSESLPTNPQDTVACWNNATSIAGTRYTDFDRLRRVAARLQADVLALVEYDWALEDVSNYLFVKAQKLQSKVQVTVVDTQSGVVLTIFEEQESDSPAPPLFRSPNSYYRSFRESQLARLRAKLTEKLAAMLRRELAAGSRGSPGRGAG